MTVTLNRWRGGAPLPFDWATLSWLPMLPSSIRIEEFTEDDTHVIRAELPGIDPERDMTLTVGEGILVLLVQRANAHKDRVHSEFHYGSFERTIALPVGAREDTVVARYDKGILTIAVKVAEPTPTRRVIEIASGPASKPTVAIKEPVKAHTNGKEFARK
jgi:HSP20 family protein